MKSTWFGDRERYEFAKCLRDVSHSVHLYELMQSFLTCAFYSFRQATHKARNGQLSEEYEQLVIKEQERHSKNHQAFGHALGILTLALEKREYDFLGTVISELDQVDSKWKGQCFTPPAVSEMMARLTVGDLKPDPNRTLLLNEPACGGGSMVIATSIVLKENGFYPWHYHWTAVDIDWRCYAITYIQTTLLGIPCTAVNGNTLSLEEFDCATNLIGTLHPPRVREDVAVNQGMKIGRLYVEEALKNGRFICACDCGKKWAMTEQEAATGECKCRARKSA